MKQYQHKIVLEHRLYNRDFFIRSSADHGLQLGEMLSIYSTAMSERFQMDAIDMPRKS